MKRAIAPILLASLVLATDPVIAQSRTVFQGVPVVKISEGGTDRVVDALPRGQALNFTCAISEIAGVYYWASRQNKELVRYQRGAFITYVAIDGSGYIRVVDPNQKGTATLMSETEAAYDYVEHLLIGLRSVTYYGRMSAR